MNSTNLASLMPTLVMTLSLAYATYALQPDARMPALLEAAAKKGGAGTVAHSAPPDGESAGSATPARDPFAMAAAPGSVAAEGAADESVAGESAADPFLAEITGMTLNATFLQGRTQMAVIDGRLYRKGQSLTEDDDGKPPLILTEVFANRVILQAGRTRYALAYPEQPGSRPSQEPERPEGLKEADPRLEAIRTILSSAMAGRGLSLPNLGAVNLTENDAPIEVFSNSTAQRSAARSARTGPRPRPAAKAPGQPRPRNTR